MQLSTIAIGYTNEEASNEIIDLLQNYFCTNSDQSIDVVDCQNFIPLFIPGVLDQISQMVAENSAYLCTELYSISCENQVRILILCVHL